MSEFKTDHAAELRRMSRKCIPSRGPWGDIPATMVQAATHIDELRDSLAAATREPEAAQRLQGYRDMGQQVAEAQNERDALRAEVEACAPYLKEDETPAQRIQREIADNAAVLSLLAKSRADVEALRNADGPWKAAVIDGLVVSHCIQPEHETDPRKALDDLISWHVAVALDPCVSSDAVKLLDAEAEACAEVCVDTYYECLLDGETNILPRFTSPAECAKAIRARIAARKGGAQP
jgi:hypothetical protein